MKQSEIQNKKPNKDNVIILGIETSCDETSASVMRGRYEVLSCVTATQIAIHRQFGGVVPEVASRNHIEDIDGVVSRAVTEASLTLSDIDAIGVTYGAGLVGALLVGVSYAKSMAYALGIPLYAVNHIEGHVAASYITHPDLTEPYVSLLVSGGHTYVNVVNGLFEKTTVAQTIDDAVGESFDKVARLLGLPYPGGIEIDRLAAQGQPTVKLPSVLLPSGDFSFSGIKTAVANQINQSRMRGEEISPLDICASFRQKAVEGLLTASKRALDRYNLKTLTISGGVAANSLLRSQAQKLSENGYSVFLPELKYCTDNGAMIAARAYQMFVENQPTAPLSLNANPSL